MPRKRTSKVYLLSNDEFIKLIKESKTYTECLKKLGLSIIGSSSRTIIKQRIKELNIDISHFDRYINNRKRIAVKKKSLDEILVKDSSYTHTVNLKERLIKENVIKYECAICHNKGIWNNNILILQLDHINGDHTDNRLENLRLLCPNCHSQTETFAGKNNTGKKRYKKQIILEDNKVIYESIARQEKNKSIQELIEKVKSSDIDFSQVGWSTKLNEILNLSSSSSAARWLKNNIPELYPKDSRFIKNRNIDYDNVVFDYTNNLMTIKDLSKKYNMSDVSVKNILKQKNIEIDITRPYTAKPVYYNKKIKMIYNDVVTVFNSIDEVRKYLLENDLLSNPKRLRDNIARCICGHRKTAYKRKWEIAE